MITDKQTVNIEETIGSSAQIHPSTNQAYTKRQSDFMTVKQYLDAHPEGAHTFNNVFSENARKSATQLLKKTAWASKDINAALSCLMRPEQRFVKESPFRLLLDKKITQISYALNTKNELALLIKENNIDKDFSSMTEVYIQDFKILSTLTAEDIEKTMMNINVFYAPFEKGGLLEALKIIAIRGLSDIPVLDLQHLEQLKQNALLVSMFGLSIPQSFKMNLSTSPEPIVTSNNNKSNFISQVNPKLQASDMEYFSTNQFVEKSNDVFELTEKGISHLNQQVEMSIRHQFEIIMSAETVKQKALCLIVPDAYFNGLGEKSQKIAKELYIRKALSLSEKYAHIALIVFGEMPNNPNTNAPILFVQNIRTEELQHLPGLKDEYEIFANLMPGALSPIGLGGFHDFAPRAFDENFSRQHQLMNFVTNLVWNPHLRNVKNWRVTMDLANDLKKFRNLIEDVFPNSLTSLELSKEYDQVMIGLNDIQGSNRNELLEFIKSKRLVYKSHDKELSMDAENVKQLTILLSYELHKNEIEKIIDYVANIENLDTPDMGIMQMLYSGRLFEIQYNVRQTLTPHSYKFKSNDNDVTIIVQNETELKKLSSLLTSRNYSFHSKPVGEEYVTVKPIDLVKLKDKLCKETKGKLIEVEELTSWLEERGIKASVQKGFYWNIKAKSASDLYNLFKDCGMPTWSLMQEFEVSLKLPKNSEDVLSSTSPEKLGALGKITFFGPNNPSNAQGSLNNGTGKTYFPYF